MCYSTVSFVVHRLFTFQHKAICEFPSKEFYNSRLQTDERVHMERARQAEELQGFWPGGSHKPFVFCNVIGEEGEIHSGWKETTKVGHESKYNKEEARQMVCISWCQQRGKCSGLQTSNINYI